MRRPTPPTPRRPPLALALLLLVGLAAYSTTPAAGRPAQAAQAAAPLQPFLTITPAESGAELYVNAGGVGQLGGTMFTNLDTGPSGHKGGYTMTYTPRTDTYEVAISGFSPAARLVQGTLSLTTTEGLDSGVVPFTRQIVEAAPGARPEVSSDDGVFRLTLLNEGTLSADTYIVTAPSFAPPAPAPAGLRFIGRIYSAYIPLTAPPPEKPMLLTWTYRAADLGGADPSQLAVYVWDALNRRWDPRGGQAAMGAVLLSTRQFATYALVAPAETPAAPCYTVFLPLVTSPALPGLPIDPTPPADPCVP